MLRLLWLFGRSRCQIEHGGTGSVQLGFVLVAGARSESNRHVQRVRHGEFSRDPEDRSGSVKEPARGGVDMGVEVKIPLSSLVSRPSLVKS